MEASETQNDEARVTKALNSREHKLKITDPISLVVFVLFLLSLALVWGIGYARGDARRLIYPIDHEGNLCGVDNVVSGGRDLRLRPYLAWFDRQNYASQVCVEECWGNDATRIGVFSDLDLYGVDNSIHSTFQRYPDFEVLRRCLPIDTAHASPRFQKFLSGSMGIHMFSDIRNSLSIVALSFPAIVALCVVHIVALHLFSNDSIWVLIIVSFTLVFGAILFSLLQAVGLLSQPTVADHNAVAYGFGREAKLQYAGISVTLTILEITLAVTVWALRDRIFKAGVMVREAGAVLTSMFSLAIFPLVPLSLCALFLSLWTFSTMTLFSCHSIDLTKPVPVGSSQYRIGGMDGSLKVALLINFIALVWVIQYILYMSRVAIAGAVKTWYFTKDQKRSKMWAGAVRKHFWRTFRYQTGSVALGALLLTLTKPMRVVLSPLFCGEKAKTYCKCGMGTCGGVCGCITPRALIEMAFSRNSFFVSGRYSARLINSHADKLFIVDKVGGFVMFLCKLNVTFAAGYLTMAGLLREGAVEYFRLFHPQTAVLMVMLLAYPVASCFLSAYEITIDTLLMCFCTEWDVCSEVFMPKSLLLFLVPERLLDSKTERSDAPSSSDKGSKK
eukprot:c20334_g1_i1.p1 GENE.c20334_g1_i1~~c20334_g1_i1.p1  ORF type:complete len:646 (-),score=124.06 c20334_g1_i1:1766-3610(-)